MANKFDVLSLHAKGISNAEIAERLGCRQSYVRATLARANGYMPPAKRQPPNAAERAEDQRDLDMLYDLDEGHKEADVAAHWGVTRDYVHNLRRRSQEAA